MTDTSPDKNVPPNDAAISEAQLIAAVSAGEAVDLDGGMLTADLLRRVVIGQTDGCTITPFGVRVRNGSISGRLDLEGALVPFPLALSRITMETGGQRGSIIARDARIRRLNISNCTIAGSIIADRAQFENGVIIAGGRISGPLLVRGALIGAALSVEGSHLGNGQQALLAAGAQISGPLVLRRARAHGEVRLQRTHLTAGLRADDIRIDGEVACLYCDAARIGGDVQLSGAKVDGAMRFENAAINGSLTAHRLIVNGGIEGIHAAGMDVAQTLDLTDAKVLGPLNVEGATIGKRFLCQGLNVDGGETAIAADVIRIGGNWNLVDARLVGGLKCPGARIGGQLRATGVRIFGSDLAIRADGAHIDGGVFFSRAHMIGMVRFPAAEVSNQFRFSGATIKVDSGIALLASGAELKRDAELNAGFQTIGGIVLDQAHVHGTCDLTASHIRSSAIVRAGTAAAHDLRHAGGDARASAQRQEQADQLALSFVDVNFDRLEMPARADERPRGIVDLSRAKVGAYVDWAATWPPVPQRTGKATTNAAPDHLMLDGFTYEHLENPAGVASVAEERRLRPERAGQRRLIWLLGQSAADTGRRFRPQAWVYVSQQLAKQGLDRDARLITVERRRRERRSQWSTPSARWESRFLDWFALYGFNPWRTVAWMAATVFLFAGIWAWAAGECRQAGCFDERVFVTSKRDSYTPERFDVRYPAFHPLAYSFDVFVPFVGFGYEDHWRANMAYGPLVTWRLPDLPAFIAGETDKDKIYSDVTITTGAVLYVLAIVQKILGLILTSLMVTAFTGLLRRHE